VCLKFHINPRIYEWLRSILVKGCSATNVFLAKMKWTSVLYPLLVSNRSTLALIIPYVKYKSTSNKPIKLSHYQESISKPLRVHFRASNRDGSKERVVIWAAYLSSPFHFRSIGEGSKTDRALGTASREVWRMMQRDVCMDDNEKHASDMVGFIVLRRWKRWIDCTIFAHKELGNELNLID